MADFDDFFLDDDGLEEEASLGPVEKAKLEVIEKIEATVKEAKRNIEYKESADFRANFMVISRYVGAMTDLEALSDPDFADIMEQMTGERPEALTDEQILDKIDEIMATVKEMSFTDLKEYENKQNTVQVNPHEDDDDDDFGF
jgi:uncharacterized protein with HEPN domain